MIQLAIPDHKLRVKVSSTNPQIQQFEKQIADWRCCPTTPDKVKQEKVQELQGKEQTIQAADEQKQKAKADSGIGQSLDIAV